MNESYSLSHLFIYILIFLIETCERNADDKWLLEIGDTSALTHTYICALVNIQNMLRVKCNIDDVYTDEVCLCSLFEVISSLLEGYSRTTEPLGYFNRNIITKCFGTQTNVYL